MIQNKIDILHLSDHPELLDLEPMLDRVRREGSTSGDNIERVPVPGLRGDRDRKERCNDK